MRTKPDSIPLQRIIFYPYFITTLHECQVRYGSTCRGGTSPCSSFSYTLGLFRRSPELEPGPLFRAVARACAGPISQTFRRTLRPFRWWIIFWGSQSTSVMWKLYVEALGWTKQRSNSSGSNRCRIKVEEAEAAASNSKNNKSAWKN